MDETGVVGVNVEAEVGGGGGGVGGVGGRSAIGDADWVDG